jgi:hypothetical protein
MSDTTPTTDPKTQEPIQTTQTEPTGEPKKEPTEGGMLRKKLEEALAKNKEYEAKEQKRKEQEEFEKQKKLEEEGKWKEALEAQKAKLQNERSKTAKLQLKTKLQAEGINPELVSLTTDALSSRIQLSDEGEPNNLDTLIEEIKTNSPSLFSQPNKVKVVPSTGSQPAGNKLTIEEIKKMPLADRPKDWHKLILEQ